MFAYACQDPCDGVPAELLRATPVLCHNSAGMTVTEFIAKWRRVNLTERSASQQHFLDLCALVGQPPPAAAD
jgi:hypothetical protein